MPPGWEADWLPQGVQRGSIPRPAFSSVIFLLGLIVFVQDLWIVQAQTRSMSGNVAIHDFLKRLGGVGYFYSGPDGPMHELVTGQLKTR